jgi:hypothetical protein
VQRRRRAHLPIGAVAASAVLAKELGEVEHLIAGNWFVADSWPAAQLAPREGYEAKSKQATGTQTQKAKPSAPADAESF